MNARLLKKQGYKAFRPELCPNEYLRMMGLKFHGEYRKYFCKGWDTRSAEYEEEQESFLGVCSGLEYSEIPLTYAEMVMEYQEEIKQQEDK